MQVARPHIRWRQRKINVTFGQVSSSLTNNAPSSDMSARDPSVLERVSTHWISAFRILNAARVFRSGFDEDTARSAVFHRFGEQGQKRLLKPWPMLLHRLIVDRFVLCPSGINVLTMLIWKVVILETDKIRVCNKLEEPIRHFAEQGIPHVPRNVGGLV